MTDQTALAARIRALGTELGPELFQGSFQLFLDQHEREPYQDVRVSRDLAYGADPRHLLDVFAPSSDGPAKPVLVFVHGGGFIQGDRRTPGTPYNDNVALFAVRNGMIGVNMTYRLAPQHQWPSGAQDVGAAVAWLRHEIGRFGGDPERIILMGTSAGAVHVASYVAKPAFHVAGGGGIAGAVLLSGLYDMATADANPLRDAYFGTDTSVLAERSSIEGLLETEIPLLYVLAEYDPPQFVAATLDVLTRTAERQKRFPSFIHALGHNHLTVSLHLNTEDRRLGTEILRFVAETTAPSAA